MDEEYEEYEYIRAEYQQELRRDINRHRGLIDFDIDANDDNDDENDDNEKETIEQLWLYNLN